MHLHTLSYRDARLSISMTGRYRNDIFFAMFKLYFCVCLVWKRWRKFCGVNGLPTDPRMPVTRVPLLAFLLHPPICTVYSVLSSC